MLNETLDERFPSFNTEQILELFNVLTQDTFQEINFLALENHFNLSTCWTSQNVIKEPGKSSFSTTLRWFSNVETVCSRKKNRNKNSIRFEGHRREKKSSKIELHFFPSFSSLSCVNRILIEQQRCSMLVQWKSRIINWLTRSYDSNRRFFVEIRQVTSRTAGIYDLCLWNSGQGWIR